MFTYLDTDGEIVLLDPFKVEGIVDLDVGVGEAVLVPGLQVEGVVLVGLICGTPDQVVEHGGVALDARAAVDNRLLGCVSLLWKSMSMWVKG